MSMQSTSGPNVAVPVASHAKLDVSKLTPKISIKNLEFFYGDSRALKGITMSLYANKATAFIGPSGCGKSTLLRILNRIYDLYPGQRVTAREMVALADPPAATVAEVGDAAIEKSLVTVPLVTIAWAI